MSLLEMNIRLQFLMYLCLQLWFFPVSPKMSKEIRSIFNEAQFYARKNIFFSKNVFFMQKTNDYHIFWLILIDTREI